MQKRSTRFVALIGAIIGWSAIIAQLYLIITNRVVSIPGTVFRFFSYFTIDTNILVALCFTFIFLGNQSRPGKLFTKATTITALTVYIIIVGIVYNTILRLTWNPQGLQMVVDEILHSVIPVLFILFWVIFVPIEGLKYKHAFSWLIYPLVYMLYAVIHGAITNFYPYMFVDVTRHGYGKVLSNAGLIVFAIFVLSFILIATGKATKDKKKSINSAS
ncbi:MAG TPA: Pr6Pr family membrane protein [Chitinophagaceae bacterium]|nr:Pr6Pr family membrane protein [Chitinophagaceae bacterium]